MNLAYLSPNGELRPQNLHWPPSALARRSQIDPRWRVRSSHHLGLGHLLVSADSTCWPWILALVLPMRACSVWWYWWCILSIWVLHLWFLREMPSMVTSIWYWLTAIISYMALLIAPVSPMHFIIGGMYSFFFILSEFSGCIPAPNDVIYFIGYAKNCPFELYNYLKSPVEESWPYPGRRSFPRALSSCCLLDVRKKSVFIEHDIDTISKPFRLNLHLNLHLGKKTGMFKTHTKIGHRPVTFHIILIECGFFNRD